MPMPMYISILISISMSVFMSMNVHLYPISISICWNIYLLCRYVNKQRIDTHTNRYTDIGYRCVIVGALNAPDLVTRIHPR